MNRTDQPLPSGNLHSSWRRQTSNNELVIKVIHLKRGVLMGAAGMLKKEN